MFFFKLHFIYLLIVCLWQSVHCSVDFEKVLWKYPSTTLKTFNPEPGKVSFQFTWDPVPNWDKDDPIIGYRLVFWEMRTLKKQVFIDDEIKLVDDENPFTSKVPVDFPKIYEVSANDRKIIINDIKPGVWYEHAALAFTKKGEGPLSSPVGIKIGTPIN